VGWDIVVFWGFVDPTYRVVASEGVFYISVFEQVRDPAYVRGSEGESCPFFVIVRACGWCCLLVSFSI
jgi:hypothetical protein